MRGVLVLRQQKQAEDFAADLLAIGFRPVIASLCSTVLLDEDDFDLCAYDGVVFTSANGVSALQQVNSIALDLLLDKSVYCVGEQTARAARDAGFKAVFEGHGTARQLHDLIYKTVSKDMSLVYISAADVSYDFSKYDLGATIHRQAVYSTVYHDTISDEAVQEIKGGAIQSICFFSAKMAQHFYLIAADRDLLSYLKEVDAICISENVAKTLDSSFWRSVRVANTPNREGMLSAL